MAGLLLGLLALMLSACDDDFDQAQASVDNVPVLRIACETTLAHPIAILARQFEDETGTHVVVTTGTSRTLYEGLKANRDGDLYLPVSLFYRDDTVADGLLGEARRIGFNVAALIVLKGNPNGIAPSLEALADPSKTVVIASPEASSIGQETRRILSRRGLYEAVTANATVSETDSRGLMRALLDGSADVILNWRGAAFTPGVRERVDVIDLDLDVAVPKTLALNLLTVSRQPERARQFMDLAASPRGQAILREFGFLDTGGHGFGE
ncbi:substrate-binding domain-containing protein [uncultured Rhodospira sp.]|uniref:substrate-binding domain-containing protein n=1 Tax=uncultured Rhodospira sp. TaxID=1936189 RepID=UPI002610C866|nr:substrate-binding domain-containing protein [uncultured Rhodospira sp.]